MKVFLGADHGGWEYKNQIREHLVHKGYEVDDVGAATLEPDDDFPQYAFAVATKVLGEEGDPRGILVCGSGIGMSIAANRIRGIRAAVVWSPELARETRQDNNSNVLCLAERFNDIDTVLAIVDSWLEEPYAGKERYQHRIDQVEELYG